MIDFIIKNDFIDNTIVDSTPEEVGQLSRDFLDQ